MGSSIRLTEAAAMLRVPYQKAHRLVLTGDLCGELRDGHWVVDAEDAARLSRQRAKTFAGQIGATADSSFSNDAA